MGGIEVDGGGHVLWIFEFADTSFEACDSLAHDLSASLTLPIVVFACVWLLCSCALLAGRLSTVTFLRKMGLRKWNVG